MANEFRDNGGRYNFKPGRPCKCGHVEHTAAKVNGEQPCIAGDFDATARECSCKSYRPAKSARFA